MLEALPELPQALVGQAFQDKEVDLPIQQVEAGEHVQVLLLLDLHPHLEGREDLLDVLDGVGAQVQRLGVDHGDVFQQAVQEEQLLVVQQYDDAAKRGA